MRNLSIVFTIAGGCAILLGAVTHITDWYLAPFVFGFGAVMFASVQFSDRYRGSNETIKRLKTQQSLGAVFILLTALLMFSSNWHISLLINKDMDQTLRSILIALTKKNTWILTLSIGAIFELYTSFRISAETEKN